MRRAARLGQALPDGAGGRHDIPSTTMKASPMRTALIRLGGVLALTLGLAFTLLAGNASAQIALSPDGGQFQAPYSSPAGGPYGPTAQGGPYGPTAHGGGTGAPSTSPAPGDAGVTATGTGQVGVDPKATYPCGWYAPNSNSFYTHCGSGRIQINVEFYWGWSTRTICVPRGTTWLSGDERLQGGFITYAYYNGRSC